MRALVASSVLSVCLACGSAPPRVATLVHSSALAAPYELVAVTYALDGQTVYDDHAASSDVALGAVAPGPHVLEATVRFRFVSQGPFAYLADQELTADASYAFDMPAERSLRVRATVYEHGEGPPEERVGVTFTDE